MAHSTVPPTMRHYGDRALLIDCDSIEQVLAFAGAVRDAEIPGVIDIVPGARTVLVTLTEPSRQESTRIALLHLDVPSPAGPPAVDGAELVIDVVYDGTDLAEVAAQLQMDISSVIGAHTGTPWRVGFCGFAPGFAYLVGGDPALSVPRRAEPRIRVPAGSVALAGEFSGVYPREAPGGWQLIGRTDAVLWDLERAPPALLTPGRWVRFRAVGTP